MEQHRAFFEPLHLFFELTTAMAFGYFADDEVDEGGDRSRHGRTARHCTNIIRPDLCVITNIGYDYAVFGRYARDSAREGRHHQRRHSGGCGQGEGDVKKVLEPQGPANECSSCFYAEAKDTDAEYFARPMQREELERYRERLSVLCRIATHGILQGAIERDT